MTEHRTAPLRDLRATRSATTATGTITGRAITYDSLSCDLGGFREVFRPGSVRLADDVLILFSHDTSKVLGRTSAGTARAYDDGLGIVFAVDPPDTTYARDLLACMKRGDIRQCSFAFTVERDDYHYDTRAQCVVREVFAAVVSELSIVAMPAYEATHAEQ